MSGPEPATSTSVTRRQALRRAGLGLGALALGGAGVAAAEGRGRSGLREGSLGSQEAGLGPAPESPFAAPPMDRVRIGFVGVGLQGSSHVRNFLAIDGVDVVAVCDIVPEKVERIQEWCRDAGRPVPSGYSRSETDFVRLCETEDLDLVLTATPWRWHVPVCVAAMNNDKHAATEVPAAYTLDGCWELVETAEARGKHCVMMENCNYDRPELMVLNMVRQGVLGEILHAECGYNHDLRAIKFEDADEGLWRRAHSWTRNGNLYPTHGLGPIANCMDINRGDRFLRLVSMSSPSRGLQEYAEAKFPPGSAKRAETFALGDVNTSMIQTALGRTIYLTHDTNLPRPYSRIHQVQGTRGIFQGYPNRVYVEGRSPSHRWEEAETYYEEFEHPIWRRLREASEGAGHGGMDFIEDQRLIECLRAGEPTDMNVYDAAALSAVCELSEISVAAGSAPVDFPDFTRGRWEEWPRWEILGG